MSPSERATATPRITAETHGELASLHIDRTRTSTRSMNWLGLVLIAALIIGLGIAWPNLHLAGVEVSVAPATLQTLVDAGAGSADLSAAGYMVADRQSTLASKATGRLEKLNVSEAQKVKSGEIIAEVNHVEVDAWRDEALSESREAAAEAARLTTVAAQADVDITTARVALATIDAEIREIQVTLADAQRRLLLDKSVAEKNALPASNVDDRRTEVSMAEAKIETARQRKVEAEQHIRSMEAQSASAHAAIAGALAKEKSAQARAKIYEAQILDAIVIAPYDAVVTQKMAEVGEIVAPISVGGMMARGSIVTIADLNSMQAEVDVAEAHISKVKPGGRAAIYIDAFPDKVFPGRVCRILPRADRSKATIQVRVDILKRDDTVLPDMGVRVRFLPENAPEGLETGAIKPKLLIPKEALQGQSADQFVWVVDQEHAKKRPVTTGETGAMVEIRSGLKPGENVVTSNIAKLTADDIKVKVIEAQNAK